MFTNLGYNILTICNFLIFATLTSYYKHYPIKDVSKVVIVFSETSLLIHDIKSTYFLGAKYFSKQINKSNIFLRFCESAFLYVCLKTDFSSMYGAFKSSEQNGHISFSSNYSPFIFQSIQIMLNTSSLIKYLYFARMLEY